MKTSLSLLTAVSLLLAAAPAYAQEAPARVDEQTLPTSNLTSPGGRNITAFDRKAQTGVGGYYDIEFVQPLNGKISTFDQHRLILQASSYLHDNLFFNTEIEFEHGGLINALTNDGELKIEQAWADYRIDDLLVARGGVVLIPFGIVNVLHDSDFRETTTRPLMASTIIPTTWMDAGFGFHGVGYPTEQMQVSYDAYVTNGLNSQISADKGIRSARPSLAKDNNGNKALSGRLGISPWLGLDFGLNGYRGAYDVSGTQQLTMLGADATWTAGPFEVLGEYANIMTDGGTFTSGTTTTAIPLGMQGYYVEGRYRFFPEFLQSSFLGRGGGFDRATFTAFGRYGGADTDLSTAGKTDRNEAVIGLNYRPVPTFVGKLEYQQILDGTGKSDGAIWSSIAVGF